MYIGQAYGMVKAIDYIFEDDCDEEPTKAAKTVKKTNA